MSKIFKIFDIMGLTRLAMGGTVYDWYIATTGNDTTGDGTKDLPYLTVAKVLTVISADETVWVEAGTYLFGNVTINKGLWYSNGALWKDNSGAGSFILLGTADIKLFQGITFDRDSTGTNGLFINSGCSNATFNSCSFINMTSYFLQSHASAGADFTWNSCNIEGGSSGVLFTYAQNMLFDGCTITNILGNGFYRYGSSGFLSVTNSTLTQVGGHAFYHRTVGDLIIDNNTINITSNFTGLILHNSYFAADLTITNNIINITAVSTADLLRLNDARFDNITIDNNTITTDATFTKGIVYVTPKVSVSVSGNTIIHPISSVLSSYQIRIIGGTDAFTAAVNDNIINGYNKDGYNIGVGSETTTANDDKITLTATGNTIYSALFYDDALPVGPHGIFVGFMKLMTVEDNYVNGAGIGIALENDGASYSGVDVTGNTLINNIEHFRHKGVSDLEISVNIFRSEKTFCTGMISGSTQLAGEHSINTDINNNILYEGTGVTLSTAWISYDADNATGISVDFDTVWSVDNDPKYTIGADVMTDWAEIQTAGYEANGNNTNPF